MSDIGKGDIVEATRTFRVGQWEIQVKTRATVERVVDSGASSCGRIVGVCGLTLREFPLEPNQGFCSCNWRRVGPGIADISGMFADELNTPPGTLLPVVPISPEPVTAKQAEVLIALAKLQRARPFLVTPETVAAWNRVWDRWTKVGPL